jgi:hypothetical protein
MRSWRWVVIASFVGILGAGCGGEDRAPPSEDAGTADAGPGDAGSDAGTAPDDAGTGPGDAGADGGTDAGTQVPNTVRITRMRRDFTSDATGVRPWDFNSGALQLFVVEDGTFVSKPGARGAQGEYVFSKVPQGPYYLKVDSTTSRSDIPTYVVTAARELDLSFNKLSRDGLQLLQRDVPAHVSMSNLEPWTGYGAAQLIFTTEGIAFAAPLVLDNLYVGATSVIEETTHNLTMYLNATRPSDKPLVLQLARREVGPLANDVTLSYSTVVRRLELPSVTNDGTQPLDFTGSFEELPVNELPLDWKLSAFTDLAAEVHPSATPGLGRFQLRTSSEPDEGWFGYPGEIMTLNVPRSSRANVTGTLVYGHPSRVRTGVQAGAFMFFEMPLEVPGGPTVLYTTSVGVQDRPANLAGKALLPRIRPPRGLTVDGTAATDSRTLAAGAHDVTWQPPPDVTPDAWRLRLRRLDPSNSTQSAITELQLYVDGGLTSVRIPSGFLRAGRHYVLDVEAIRSEGYSMWNKPFSNRVGYDWAPVVSGVLSVPAEAP